MIITTKFGLGGLILQLLLIALVGSGIQLDRGVAIKSVAAEQIPLSSVLPKLESVHEEVKSLLIKNAKLKNKILTILQAQNEAKIRLVQSAKMLTTTSNKPDAGTGSIASAGEPISENNGSNKTIVVTNRKQQDGKLTKTQHLVSKNSTAVSSGKQSRPASLTMRQKSNADDPSNKSMIDFNELEDFNKWVETNLEYAVKNTQASAEALKEEAQQNNGTVDYSEQAIKDGLEGVKYWQSAVMFQDKTLRNEKFDPID